MIIGIGTDLCDIRRIERTLDRFGDRFVDRLFAEGEQKKAYRRQVHVSQTDEYPLAHAMVIISAVPAMEGA